MFWSDELGYWVVSRYADARRCCATTRRSRPPTRWRRSRRRARPPARALADGGFRSIPTLTNVDPPAHTRTRRIAQVAFSPRRVAAMEPFVRDLVRRFIDERLHDGQRRDRGGADVGAAGPRRVRDPRRARRRRRRRQAGRRQPAAVHVRPRRRRPSRSTSPPAWPRSGATARRWPRTAGPRRATTSPPTSCTRPTRPAQPLTQQEVADDPVRAPARRPRDDHQPPRQRPAPAARGPATLGRARAPTRRAIPGAVEEVLRYDSSVVHWRRRTTTGRSTLSGVELPAGADVLVCIGAANRDPSVFARPRRVRPPAAQRPRAPLVRLRPPPLPRRAAGPPRGPRRARGAHRRAARASASTRPDAASSCRSSASAARAPPRRVGLTVGPTDSRVCAVPRRSRGADVAKLTPKKRAALKPSQFGLPEQARTKKARKETGQLPDARQGPRRERRPAGEEEPQGRQPHQGRVQADPAQGAPGC